MPIRFSIVTPTRNALPKLRRCVGSVRGQQGVAFCHLVQDALSADGTQEWLASQGDLDWRSEIDDGMYDAINIGWSRAQGEILCWLNSDEQYLPGALRLVEQAFAADEEVDFVYGDALVVDGGGGLIAARREIRLSRRYLANGFLNAFSCATFFRRRLWDEGILRLDSRYRYAADMDLVLRLLHAGKRFAKLPAYLAAFTLDGTNLSCHPAMLDETAAVQRRYGGYKSPWARRLVMLGRYVERFASGSYRAEDVEYDFALDEKPSYRRISAAAVPGSYRTR